MATRQVDLGEAGALLDRLAVEIRTRAVDRGVSSFMLRAKPMMEQATDNARSPNPKNLGKGAFDTGNYRQRWKTLKTTSGGLPGVIIQNDAPYAGVIEYGRRRGARAPRSSVLEPWVRRKLGVPYKDVKSVAFLIARSIKRRGLKPRYVLTARTMEIKLEKAFKEEILREVIDAATRLA